MISATFCQVFAGFSPAFGLGLGAVLGISAVSATFSRLFSGFLAEFGSCFGDFCSFSYFFSAFSGFLAEFGELFWGFLLFQLLFAGFFPAFWLGLMCTQCQGHLVFYFPNIWTLSFMEFQDSYNEFLFFR